MKIATRAASWHCSIPNEEIATSWLHGIAVCGRPLLLPISPRRSDYEHSDRDNRRPGGRLGRRRRNGNAEGMTMWRSVILNVAAAVGTVLILAAYLILQLYLL